MIDPVQLLLISLADGAAEWVAEGDSFHRKGIMIHLTSGLFGLRPSVELSIDGEKVALQREEQMALRDAVKRLEHMSPEDKPG